LAVASLDARIRTLPGVLLEFVKITIQFLEVLW
jgi:hypothetical protein